MKQTFRAPLIVDGNRGWIEVPFDPDAIWGVKERHHITGHAGPCGVRGALAREEGAWRLYLGPVWRRDAGVRPGDVLNVMLMPEGPQRDGLDPDLKAALEENPQAGAFWDSLATFYRKGYLRWLDGAARRPTLREERVRQWLELLAAGKKERD